MDIQQYRDFVVPVANSEWKQAALYFNHIMPVQMKYFPIEISYNDETLFDLAGHIYMNKFKEIFHDHKTTPPVPNDEREIELIRQLDVCSVWPIVILLRAEGIPAIPLFSFRESYSVFGEGENEAIEVKILEANLVDADALEWDQIIEFRKDKDSAGNLRNFRLFMFDNYANKPVSYIRDSIECKIEKHNDAAKKHGLMLTKTVISELVDSKSSLGCLGLATVSHLLGDNVTAASLGIAGVSLALAKMTINIATQYVSYKTDTSNPELAYVTKARKLLEQR